ncbi:hypothetical protein WG907_04265 [Sphingobium sp. AN558]|uniref:hypothetical protein n=1 Tax=Sphingobium sp. AN558 TaxID=3133442 RepID=UPI0030C0051A
MPDAPLDFWNYPAWLGDARDNPRDPGFEPFWMRDAAQPVVVQTPVYVQQSGYGIMVDSGTYEFRHCRFY